MRNTDFSRLSVLLVEDSRFMQSLYIGLMRALGINKITIASNGEEAISILRPLGGVSSGMHGQTGIDIVVADYLMPVVDGMFLLRWVRRADKSPDKFLPFVMISAAADRDVLFEARDSGVDEFVAKPLSPLSLALRLRAIIKYPRPFIYCSSYFGPDRRRQNKPVKDDRRKTTKSEIETLYSGKDIRTLATSKKPVWVFRLPNQLKNKLDSGYFSDDRKKDANKDDNLFDPEMLKQAEKMISSMENDYMDWVTDSINGLKYAYHHLLEDFNNPLTHLEKINEIGHELRGQGGAFGYPLMTQFGRSLFEITKDTQSLSPQILELIKSHIDLINTVVQKRIKGSGGKVGQELL